MTGPEETTSSQKNCIRIMCEYSSNGVWSCVGDFAQEFGNVPELSWMFDHDAHAALGLFIARLVKYELPDWTVFYFDARKVTNSHNQPREEFEYEIILDRLT
jgi:hypothetical protein